MPINETRGVATIVGIALLAGAGFICLQNAQRIDSSLTAHGTVMAVKETVSYERDSDNPRRKHKSIHYSPVISFIPKNGNAVIFTSSGFAFGGLYDVGDSVKVLYNPATPKDDPVVGDFWTLWLIPTVLGIFGLISFLIGVSAIFNPLRFNNKLNRLKQDGVGVEAEIVGVEYKVYTIAEKSPFQIIAQWTDPMTGITHRFMSDKIWIDAMRFLQSMNPAMDTSALVETWCNPKAMNEWIMKRLEELSLDKKITIYMERDNPRKYCIDTSFLPKLMGVGENEENHLASDLTQ